MNQNERGITAHKLLSDIRNARYETVWLHVQELLDQPDIWQDFTTGDGTTYEFYSHEFDWFLAELTPDLDTLIRDSMIKAPPELELRYADLCGRGQPTTPDQRRPHETLAARYPDAAKRLATARPTPRRTVGFSTPEGRAAHIAGQRITKETRAGQREFRVRVSGDDDLAIAIAARLEEDLELADQVFKRLDAAKSRRRHEHKRSSNGTTDVLGARPSGRRQV